MPEKSDSAPGTLRDVWREALERDDISDTESFFRQGGTSLAALSVLTGYYDMVGPNGAGKSTAIRHLSGILRQDSGDVSIDGQPVFENPSVKERIAYIPDDVFYFPQATINDMVFSRFFIYPAPNCSVYQGVSVSTYSEYEVSQLIAGKWRA